MPTNLQVLLVEDDASHVQSIRQTLERDGHIVIAKNSKDSAIQAVKGGYAVDFAIVDIALRTRGADEDGLDLVRQLRRDGYEFPIIVLTAADREHALPRSLAAEADDCVTKGAFSAGAVADSALFELAFRIKQQQAMKPMSRPFIIRRRYIAIDTVGEDVYFRGKCIPKLAKRRFEVLCYIVRNPGARSKDVVDGTGVDSVAALYKQKERINRELGFKVLTRGNDIASRPRRYRMRRR